MGASENKRLIEDLNADLSAGRGEALFKNLADDACWTMMGTTRYSGTFHGKQEIMAELLGPLVSRLDGPMSITADRIIAEGDFVVVQSRGKGSTKSGKTYDNSYCSVYRVVDGLIREITEYLDTEVVTAAFGR